MAIPKKNRCKSVWSVGLFVVQCSKKDKHGGLHCVNVHDGFDDADDPKWGTIVWSD